MDDGAGNTMADGAAGGQTERECPFPLSPRQDLPHLLETESQTMAPPLKRQRLDWSEFRV